VHFYYIGRTVDCPQLETVERAVNKAFNVTLAPELFRSDRFKALQQEGRAPPAPPDAIEVAASHALSGRGIRALAVAIKSSGGLLVGDLSKQLPLEDRGRTEEFRKTLESTGLVGSEIVVVCMKTQGQIARAPSEDVLRAMSDRGVKCACGRPISDERIEKAVTITDLGRALLDGNRWLTLLLLEELQEVGIPLGNTLIEQQVGGDEIDCLADISGELAFFELKDKDFNLGNAYSFGAKMGIIRPHHPVIFSTTKVGNDAREHFERARSAGRSRYEEMYLPEDPSPEIRYIEGVECLRVGIQELATAIHRGDALRILRRVLPFAALDAGALLSALEHQDHKRAATKVISGREVEHTCDSGAEALVSEGLTLPIPGAVAVTAQ